MRTFTKEETKMKPVIACSLIAGAWSLVGHAEVTMYGSLNASIESVKATGSGTSELPRETRIATNNSWLGFRGNEDLGSGLKAIWQVESSLRSFEQGGTNDLGQTAILGTRNTYLGLQGDFGKAYLGNSDSAYKALGDLRLDPFINTTASVFGGIFDRGGARLTNSVHYFSPKLAGFKAAFSYGFDEARPHAANGTVQNNHRMSVAGRYEWQALTLGLAYDRQGSKLNAAKSAPDYDWRAFSRANASYAFATGTTVATAFERDQKSYGGMSDTRQDAWMAALTQAWGRTSVSVVYASLGKLQNATAGQPDDYKARQWVLGAKYDLSKTTQLYAFATKIHNNSRSAINFTSVTPLFDKNVGSATAALTPGNDPQSVGVGMRIFF